MQAVRLKRESWRVGGKGEGGWHSRRCFEQGKGGGREQAEMAEEGGLGAAKNEREKG